MVENVNAASPPSRFVRPQLYHAVAGRAGAGARWRGNLSDRFALAIGGSDLLGHEQTSQIGQLLDHAAHIRHRSPTIPNRPRLPPIVLPVCRDLLLTLRTRRAGATFPRLCLTTTFSLHPPCFRRPPQLPSVQRRARHGQLVREAHAGSPPAYSVCSVLKKNLYYSDPDIRPSGSPQQQPHSADE